MLAEYGIKIPDLMGVVITACIFEDALEILTDEGINVGDNPKVIKDVNIRKTNQDS
jgi:hypothetical protein